MDLPSSDQFILLGLTPIHLESAMILDTDKPDVDWAWSPAANRQAARTVDKLRVMLCTLRK